MERESAERSREIDAQNSKDVMNELKLRYLGNQCYNARILKSREEEIEQ